MKIIERRSYAKDLMSEVVVGRTADGRKGRQLSSIFFNQYMHIHASIR